MGYRAVRRGWLAYDGSLPRGVLLLGDGDGRADVLDVFKHEDGVLLCILEFLEEKKRFLIVTQAALNTVSYAIAIS